MLIFDIETGPIESARLLAMMPAFESKEFDESDVKTGNLKDPDKVAAKIDQARQKHLADQLAAEANHVRDWVDRAPLSPVTGQVLAIGYHSPDRRRTAIDDCSADGGEKSLIKRFWKKCDQIRNERRSMVGLNTHDFDLPFLRRRSWILGIQPPGWIINQDRFWHETFVDLRKRWLSGNSWSTCKSSFDHLAVAFGTGGKPDDVSGKHFHVLWNSGNPEDREAAVQYLTNDVEQPAEWAASMGVL